LAGKNWREEIRRALEATKVAILLVSADFLASKFIAEDELPPLLEAAQLGGAIILPVILSPCVFEDTPLQQYQAINSPSKPLSKMKGSERDEVWVTLVRTVMKLVKETVE
jgi:TIR domain